MTFSIYRSAALAGAVALTLAACSQGAEPDSSAATSTDTATAKATVKSSSKDAEAHDYMFMEKFDTQMGEFVGLKAGESFAQSKPKIDAVFKAYDGHAEPLDIQMKKSVVEAGWTEVVVTQKGLMDGTVAGQQLLAIYDQNDQLVTYGMRIQCHVGDNVSEWQNTGC